MVTERIGPPPSLAIDRAGEGDAVIFLHGVGGNRTNWRDQIAAFAATHHVIAMDARGWGDSDDYEGPLRVDDMAADVVRVLDHVGARKVHIVGLSMGGMVAQHVWFAHPARVKSLVLCDTSPGLGQSQTPEQRAEFLRLRQKPLLEGKTPADIAPEIAATLLSAHAAEESRQRLIDSLSALHTASYLKALEALAHHQVTRDYASIAVPCLLIVGAEDRLTPPSVHETMQKRIPGSRLTVIQNAGHLSNIEQPAAFNAALREHLAHAG